MAELCRHCKLRIGCHNRGLCWRCNNESRIRVLYPSKTLLVQQANPSTDSMTMEELDRMIQEQYPTMPRS